MVRPSSAAAGVFRWGVFVVMIAALLESAGPILTVLTPLVVVPLTIITFYLRALREHQMTRHADLARKVDAIETSSGELRKALAEFDRYYTTKEEWLRECMQARQGLEQLTKATVRIETAMGAYLGQRCSNRSTIRSTIGTRVARPAVDPSQTVSSPGCHEECT